MNGLGSNTCIRMQNLLEQNSLIELIYKWIDELKHCFEKNEKPPPETVSLEITDSKDTQNKQANSGNFAEDAFNLAWKIAYSTYLSLGLNPALLKTFSTERQPVGQTVITRANDGVRQHKPLWEALGMIDESVEVRRKKFAELKSATKEGQERRKRLQAAIEMTAHEL